MSHLFLKVAVPSFRACRAKTRNRTKFRFRFLPSSGQFYNEERPGTSPNFVSSLDLSEFVLACLEARGKESWSAKMGEKVLLQLICDIWYVSFG